MGNSKVVLVTGASSGIGQAIAELLSEKGMKVYGTSRKCDGGIIEKSQYYIVKMDVCDEVSVQNAVNMIVEREGRIDILVNNAGIGIAGAVEDMSHTECYKQMDTNFFGVLRMIRSVLPVMRKQKSGLIINIGSVAGFISIPYQALYSAGKYAVEAVTEALRAEIKPFGIKAALVEPGDTKTGFTRSRVIAQSLSGESVYKEASLRSIGKMEKDEQNGCSPEKVAKTVFKVICKNNPPVRTVVGFEYKLAYILKKLLPTSLVEKIITGIYG